jgi:hypothetical protein
VSPLRRRDRIALPTRALFVPLFAALTLAAAGPGPVEIPAEEELRRFLEDGPLLLLPEGDQERLKELAGSAPDRALESARAFLAADPKPDTPANELAAAIERRQQIVWSEELSLRDARGMLRFLRGAPRERKRVECGETFRPLEIWSWGPVEQPESVVLFQPRPGAFYTAWRPTGSKRQLYSTEMEYYLEQWEELRRFLSGKRPDRVLCEASAEVDRVTGVDGLFGFKQGRLTDAEVDAFFAPPSDLAAWATAAAGEKLERVVTESAGAPEKRVPIEPLAVSELHVTFPERRDQRMVTRVRVILPEDPPHGVVEAEFGKESRFTVTALVELAGVPFDEFRNRFVVPATDKKAPIVLVGERLLRPGGPYVATLELRDEISGRTAWITRGFRVPAEPTPEEDPSPPGAVEVSGQETGLTKFNAKSALVLLPPLSDVVFGLWRAEAIVAGETIRKVAFFLNGNRVLERGSPPWTAELRLPNLPTELVVRAEGLDEAGAVVASDEVVLNEPQGEPKVRLISPERGK